MALVPEDGLVELLARLGMERELDAHRAVMNHAHRAWSSCVHVALDGRVLRVRFAPRARPAIELDPQRVRALRQIDDAVLVDSGAVPDVLLYGVQPEQARHVAELLAAALAVPVATH